MAVVLATAMEKDRNRRYQTAEAFAEDLRRVREREPISAKPAGPILRARRWAQRNPVVATSATALFVLLAGGLGVTTHFLGQTAALLNTAEEERDAKESALSKVEETLEEVRSERDAKEAAFAETEEERRKVQWERYRLAIADADTAIREGRTEAARQILEACREEFRGWEWRNLLSRTDTSLVTLSTGTSRVTGLSFVPDGRRLVATTFSDEGSSAVQVWNMASNSLVRTIETTMTLIRGVAVSPDGEVVAASGQASEDNPAGTVRIWDSYSGAPLGSFMTGDDTGLGSLVFHPTKPLLVSMDHFGELFAWNTENRTLVWNTDFKMGPRLGGLAFDPEGDRLACVPGSAAYVNVVDTAAGQLVGRVWFEASDVLSSSGDQSQPLSVAWSRDGTRLAVGSTTGQLWIVDPNVPGVMAGDPNAGLIHNIAAHKEQIRDVVFSADGTLVATVSGSTSAWSRHEAAVWDVKSGQLKGMLYGHTGAPTSAEFSSEGRLLATGATDGMIRIWDSKTAGSPMEQVLQNWYPIQDVEVSPDGSRIATGDLGGVVSLWNPLTGQNQRWWNISHSGPVQQVAWADGGDSIISGSQDGWLRRFIAIGPDTSREVVGVAVGYEEGNPERIVGRGRNTSPEGVWSIAVVPGTAKVLLTDFNRTENPTEVRLEAWDMEGGSLLWENTEPGEVNTIVLDHSGTRYFAVSFTEDLAEGTVADGAWVRTIASKVGDRPVNYRYLTVSPDGTRLAVSGAAGYDGFGGQPHGAGLFVLDTETGALLNELQGHTAPVVKPAFMADGLRLVTGSDDATVRIWGVEEGQSLSVLEGHEARVTGVDVHPEGDFIVSASGDGTARVWLSTVGLERYRASYRHDTLADQAQLILQRTIQESDGFGEMQLKIEQDPQLSEELKLHCRRAYQDFYSEMQVTYSRVSEELLRELVIFEDVLARIPELTDVPRYVRDELLASWTQIVKNAPEDWTYAVHLTWEGELILYDSGAAPDRYELAGRAAEVVMESWFEGTYWYAIALRNLAWAQYRMGDWASAVENAEWSQFLLRDVEPPSEYTTTWDMGKVADYGEDEPVQYCVIAMSQHQLGQEEAAGTLRKLKEVMARVPRGDTLRWGLFREVLALLEGTGAQGD